jgi:hypothetical protein
VFISLSLSLSLSLPCTSHDPLFEHYNHWDSAQHHKFKESLLSKKLPPLAQTLKVYKKKNKKQKEMEWENKVEKINNKQKPPLSFLQTLPLFVFSFPFFVLVFS